MIATRNSLHSSLAVLTILLISTAGPRGANAQNTEPAPEPRPSPLALAQVTLDDGTYVKVHYSSPRMRGREIFGGLVPLNEVWRFGANEATELTITRSIEFGGEELSAGSYAIFAIPGEETWTIIVNGGLGQWGAFSYSDDDDVLRIDVPAETTEKTHEAFTIRFDEADGGSGANMVAVWADTQISIPIRPSN